MKKLLIVLGVFVLVLSGCFFDFSTEDWDGTLEGTQYYTLSVTQDGSILSITVSVDETELAAYKDGLDEDESFIVPEELFFWISPTFKDGHERSYMYPVKRKRITFGKLFDENGEANGTTQTVTIDLARIARDWNFGWLYDGVLDGDGDESATEDDLNGVYIFMSDAYSRYDNYDDYYYDDGYYEDDYYYARGLADSSQDFTFTNSRPSGQGYSNVVDYTGEAYQPFTLLGSGLYVEEDEIFGGEPVKITLQLDEGFSWSSMDRVFVNNWNNDVYDFYLDDTNKAAESTDTTIVWYVVFEAFDYGAAQTVDELVDGETKRVYHHGAESSDYEIRYEQGWQSAWFYYMGYPNIFIATDFDGNDTGMTGAFGTGPTEIIKSTDYHWDMGDTPLNDYNNWVIGEITDSSHQYEGYTPGTNVLAISAGTDVSDFYDWYRNDIVTFPAPPLANPYPTYTYVTVSFKARPEMDWSWYDEVVVEFENDYGGWDWIGSFSGGLEWYQLEEDNGWSTHTFEAYTGESGTKRVRLRFYSNSWDENVGILIDDFKVMELQ